MRGKRIIRTVLDKYTDAVSDDNAKMICRARGQSVDIRSDVLVCVPAVNLEWSKESVINGGAVVKTNPRGHSVRINHSVERG